MNAYCYREIPKLSTLHLFSDTFNMLRRLYFLIWILQTYNNSIYFGVNDFTIMTIVGMAKNVAHLYKYLERLYYILLRNNKW